MPTTELLVPESENDLSRVWLQAALATSFPTSGFTSLTCSRIGEAYGFASQLYRCQWQERSAKRSVVVKLWSTDSKAGIQEVLFYSHFKDIGIRIPQYFYSAKNDASCKAVLVIEDLMDATQAAEVTPLNLTQTENIARMLARLHGRWLNHSKLHEYSWLPQATRWTQEHDWLISRKTECLERFDEYLIGFARQLLSKIELAPEAANERLVKSSATLFHDDFHLDNILFEKQSEPVLLDWSSPTVGPSAYNLVDLLLFMSPLEYFDTVFQCYLDEFNHVSKTPQHEQELKHQMGGALLQRFSRSTCGAARWQPSSERGLQLMKDNIAHSCRVITFWNSRDPGLFSFAH